MLEFYPMPTNLNHGSGLYHQNHGGARFLDNPVTQQGLNASGNCIQQQQQQQQHQQHQQQQQNQHQHLQQAQQQMTTSPTQATCAPNSQSGGGNESAPVPLTASSTASLTAQIIGARSGASTPSSLLHASPASGTHSGSPSTHPHAHLQPHAHPHAHHLGALPIAAPATTTLLGPSGPAPLASSPASGTGSGSVAGTGSGSGSAPTPASAPLTDAAASSASSGAAANSSTPAAPISSSSAAAAAAVVAAAAAAAAVLAAGAAGAATSSSSSASASASKLPADCSGRTEVGHIKCEKNYEICEGCGQKIHDRYLMNVGDSNWHEQCLACCYCGMQLHNTCYIRNAKLYCKLDYDRLFGIKCAACCHSILAREMVMRPIPNFVFHLTCFVCYACRLPLQKGEQFILRDGQLFCYRHDFEKEMYLAAAAAAQHCGYVGMALDEDELMRPRDGRRGPKRPRTILTSQQRKQFKASFDQSPKPCRKVREALAKDTGLSVRVVQVWFQNQRAKMKKIQRKAKNGGSASGGSAASTGSTRGGSGGSGGSGGGVGGGGNGTGDDKDKDRDEKAVKQESGSGSENGYLGLEPSFASQPLNPNLPFSPDDYPAHSNDSFCSSDLSLDGSNFDQLDDDADSLSLNNLELQSTGSSGHHHSNPHEMIANLNTSLINPIDKLYLMQNSYFSSEQ